MKYLSLLFIILLSFSVSFAQNTQRSVPGQQAALKRMQNLYDSLSPMQKNMFLTEIKHIMDPEVTIVKPGRTDDDPPSDAIILFNGNDLNKEWQESGFGPDRKMTLKPAVTWIVKDG
ncbi:MAG: hypothetical protein GYA71_09815, partial [Bacteroidales bacterium]|nr:hypothetical protein [Bacteroidales bacterium]